MELWDKITGTVRLRLTAADPEGLLDTIIKTGIFLWDIKKADDLSVTFRVRRVSLRKLRELTENRGAEIKVLGLNGVYYRVREWGKRPLILLFLLIATWFVPCRVLFIQVRGNDTVPTRLILETAASHGLYFGASRREVRSEGLKNQLLGAIEELEWVGVNTSGCVATITVRERELEAEAEVSQISNIVSATDGIIDTITLIRGTLLCGEGQAVRAGQVLVSGYEDLGIATRTVEAEAEIYAVTSRNITAALPETTLLRGEATGEFQKISLIVGKKRINLHSGSGILPATCGKMTTVKSLTMPGGWTLPVKLVVEEYISYDPVSISRENPEQALTEAAERTLTGQTVACTILTRQPSVIRSQGRFELRCRYECREMIARRESAAYLEGDAKDDHENGERGAG